ncbi:C39 family peptidase [Heyndrickxia sp. NPDC080065]|uniref:C39 family peptidase n=1 Tax=Heyndrickxia sp. NPDC080065 TaxID=3390568 RepID=UPI003CFE4483
MEEIKLQGRKTVKPMFIALFIFTLLFLAGCSTYVQQNKLDDAQSTASVEKKNDVKSAGYPFPPYPLHENYESTSRFKVQLDVPIISQSPELPTGCEITAVTMLLQFKGVDIDKLILAHEMPKHEYDPNIGYVGDPLTDSGWTIYPSALMDLVRKYTGSAKNISGIDNKKLEKQLLDNKPVVVWVSPMHEFKVHALVLTGFDKNNYYYNDSWTGQENVKISKNKFNTIWGNQNKRAITY